MIVSPPAAATDAALPLPGTSGNPLRTFWTVPNLLSLGRGLLTVWMMFAISQSQWPVAWWLFVIAASTDAIDGWYARKYRCISVFGRIFDPLVDKLLILGALVFLQEHPASRICPWTTSIILGRELAITSVRAYVEQQGLDFSAGWSGKLKMILQSLLIPACLLVLWHPDAPYWPPVRDFLLYSTLAITIYSGGEYVWRARQLLSAQARRNDHAGSMLAGPSAQPAGQAPDF